MPEPLVMRRLVLAFLIVLGSVPARDTVAQAQTSSARDVSIAVPPPVLKDEGFDPAQSAGIFVGVRNFEDKAFTEVPFAVDDAVDLAHLFALELKLIPALKVVLSLAGEPQKEASKNRLQSLRKAGAQVRSADQSEIYRSLSEQRKATGPGGLFVAAFATHGFSPGDGDFLVAPDSLRSFLERTGIALGEVLTEVSRADARRRIVLLDACRERYAARGGVAPMSDSFAQAIAEARGQAVLSGATANGFAYDDFDLENGVFTAALLRGVKGAAPADRRGFITLATLAGYVNDQVLAWVGENRPEHADRSRGIERRFDQEVATLPLALEVERFRAVADYQVKREAAEKRLYENSRLESILSGSQADEIARALEGEMPTAAQLDLLERIEALDGSDQRREYLALYFDRYRAQLPDGASPRTPPRHGDRWTDPVVGMEWVYVEPDEFWMGSPKSEVGHEDDEKRHLVKLTRGFWMATTEVTQAQFGEFVKAETYETEAENEGSSRALDGATWVDKKGVSWKDSGGSDHPVVHVSWNDAQAFATWLSGRLGTEIRLPTEAEWEYAARAGTEAATYAGNLTIRSDCDAPELEDIAWYCGNSDRRAHPAGKKKPNPWGLYDMLGNVWEWVSDRYEKDYQAGPDPQGPSRGSTWVIRGGSWADYARFCRAADRSRFTPGLRCDNVGFRLVRTSE